MTAFDHLLEDVKPTVYKIIEESGTLIPNFIERRVADKYIRSTLITLLAQYGQQVSTAIQPVLPIAKSMFNEKYYGHIVTLKELVDTPIYQFGSQAAVEARQSIIVPNMFKSK